MFFRFVYSAFEIALLELIRYSSSKSSLMGLNPTIPLWMLHAMLIVFDESFINECAVLRWFSTFIFSHPLKWKIDTRICETFSTVTMYITLEVQFDIVTVNGLVRGGTLTKLEYKCCFLFSGVVKWK